MTKRKQKTKFFTFHQNNSGGSFSHDPKRGIGENVIIEAKNAEDANHRALDIGLYFGGGIDCECCGNRWHSLWDDEKGSSKPTICSQDVSKGIYLEEWSGWGLDSYIHYMNGVAVKVKHVEMTTEQKEQSRARRAKEMAKWETKFATAIAKPKRKKTKK